MCNKSRFLAITTTGVVALILCSFPAANSEATTLSDLFGSAISGSTGTAAFDDGQGLSGTIDYAVFDKTDFDTLFANSTVSVGANELAYVYQLDNTGSDFVSQNRISGFNTSVTDIGWANVVGGIGEVDPSSVNLVVPPPFGIADWFYAAPNNIDSGEISAAMVLTSTNLPGGTTLDVVFNGGGTATASVIAPGNVTIPEPASVALLGIGIAAGLFRRRSKNVG